MTVHSHTDTCPSVLADLPENSNSETDSPQAEEQSDSDTEESALPQCTIAAVNGLVNGLEESDGPRIFNLSLKQSIEAHGKIAEDAAINEIMQLHKKPMWIGVKVDIAKRIPRNLKIHSRIPRVLSLDSRRQLQGQVLSQE